MPKLKALSGQDVLRIFAKFGFEKVDQEGSHVKIRRQLLAGGRQSLTVPLHDEIDKGTLKAAGLALHARRHAGSDGVGHGKPGDGPGRRSIRVAPIPELKNRWPSKPQAIPTAGGPVRFAGVFVFRS
jgi:predicted RNA binding protein YcfA (HicA-like mRNA interferase family)